MISMDPPQKMERSSLIDSADSALFGETLGELLKNTQELQVFKLSNFLTSQPDSVAHINAFPILDQQKIGASLQRNIADLLNSERPYLEDRSMKNLCIFQPDMAFVFLTNEKPINVLISLDCRMVRYYFQPEGEEERFIELSTKRAFKDFVELYANFFPEKKSKPKKGFADARKMSNNKTSGQYELTYQVRSGQGFSQVAKQASKQYNRKITIDDILHYNQMSKNHTLHIGDKLIVGYTQ